MTNWNVKKDLEDFKILNQAARDFIGKYLPIGHVVTGNIGSQINKTFNDGSGYWKQHTANGSNKWLIVTGNGNWDAGMILEDSHYVWVSNCEDGKWSEVIQDGLGHEVTYTDFESTFRVEGKSVTKEEYEKVFQKWIAKFQ